MGGKVEAGEPSHCALVSTEEREGGRHNVALAPGGQADRALAPATGHWDPGAHLPWALDRLLELHGGDTPPRTSGFPTHPRKCRGCRAPSILGRKKERKHMDCSGR